MIMSTETKIETGFIGPASCPVCDSETRFWLQTNGRAMCPCSARRAFEPTELGLSADSETSQTE
jgi:hypothetical protein